MMCTVGFRLILNVGSAIRIAITAMLLAYSTASLGQHTDIPRRDRINIERHEQFFYGAVCDFVEVRLHHLLKLVSGKSAGRFISERTVSLENQNRYFNYNYSFNEYITTVNFLRNDLGEAIFIDGYISGAHIQTDDKDAIHLLSRLGIKTYNKAGIVQVKCEETLLEIEFHEKDLISLYLHSINNLKERK